MGLKIYIGCLVGREKLRCIQFSIAKDMKNYSRNLEQAWLLFCCFFWYSILMFFAFGLLFLFRFMVFTKLSLILVISPMINCMASAKVSLCCLIFIAWKIKSWTRLSENHYTSKFIDISNVKCYLQQRPPYSFNKFRKGEKHNKVQYGSI